MTSPPHVVFGHHLLRDPHGQYNAPRGQAPVHHIRTPDGALAWLVMCYDDVRAALTDPQLSVEKRCSDAHRWGARVVASA